MKTSWGYRKRMIKARLKGGGMVIIFALLLGIGGLVTLSPNAQNFARNIPAAVNTFIIGEDPRKLGEVVVVGEETSNTQGTNSSVSLKNIIKVGLKLGGKKGYYDVTDLSLQATFKSSMLKPGGGGEQNGQTAQPTVVVEEYQLGLCLKGQGKIPYYLTFLYLGDKKPQIKLPVHLLGDPYSLLRFREGRREWAVYVPMFAMGRTDYIRYLDSVRRSNVEEDDINIRSVNVPVVGSLCPAGLVCNVGSGLAAIPDYDMEQFQAKLNPLWEDKKYHDMYRYIFEFDLLGRKQGVDYVRGVYNIPGQGAITDFGTAELSTSPLYLRFPGSIAGLSRHFIELVNYLAKQGVLNQTLVDPNALSIPTEVKIQEATDCVAGCTIYGDDLSNPKVQRVYKLMAITPFVINIDTQVIPEYYQEEFKRVQGAPLGLRMAQSTNEEEVKTGSPPEGTYLFVGVDTYCEGGLEGLPEYFLNCYFVDLLPDKVVNFIDTLRGIIGKEPLKRNNVFCSVELTDLPEKFSKIKGKNPKEVLAFLQGNRLGTSMRAIINLGVPVISSLTLDSPNGLTFKPGISHSLVDAYWSEVMRRPTEALDLNYVETFYVMGKIRFQGANLSDLRKIGALANLERLAKARGMSVEELAKEFKEDLEDIGYIAAPVVVTTSTKVKLYPRVSEDSDLAVFFTKELGPYPIRIYSFLGHNLSWIFRTAMSISEPSYPECNNGRINPYVVGMLSTLSRDYNYTFGQIVLKVSHDEQRGKLRFEFEYENTPPFDVPKKKLDLEKDKEFIQKCMPGIWELYTYGRI